jgi:hypothetical protein
MAAQLVNGQNTVIRAREMEVARGTDRCGLRLSSPYRAVASKPANEPKASIRLSPKPPAKTTLGLKTSREKPWKPLRARTATSNTSRVSTSAARASPSTLALMVTSKQARTATSA